MFGTLIESRAIRARRTGANVISVAVHAAGVTAALVATHRVETLIREERLERAVYVRPQVEQPPPDRRTTASEFVVAPRGFRLLAAPITIPDVLPRIDLTQAVTRPDDFTGAGVPGGSADGVATPATGIYTDAEVERTASLVPGSAAPVYPDVLRGMRVEGDVLVEFVVDTLGRAELAGLRIVASSHERFTDAVVKALGRARFVPARVGGRPVRQRVVMPFVFSLRP